MIVSFITPTRISYIDLISMGGSEKVGDESKIGKFASGLKYGMALMLKNDIKFSVQTFNNGELSEHYTVGTHTLQDKNTNKHKELLSIKEGQSGAYYDTGFSVDLGVDWECWMILRELFSNMKDEDGYYTEGNEIIDCGTIMHLDFEITSPFYDIWINRHLYINEVEPIYKVTDKLFAIESQDKYLRIYKQGILVYEDKEKYSEYGWEIKFGEIDERRILSNITGVLVTIADEIAHSSNLDFLRTIIKSSEWIRNNDFLQDACSYTTISNTVKNLIYSIYEEFDEVYTYSYLYNSAKEAKDSIIAGRKIKTVNDHIWNYYNTVTINEFKAVIEQKVDNLSIKESIESIYQLKIDCEVKVTSLDGADVIVDKHNKCILLGEKFDCQQEIHIAKFIVQYVDLVSSGNLIDNLALLYIQSIKK